MSRLKEHIKIFIIQHLACFDTPTEVANAVKDEFGVELNRAHVALYDPTNHSGRQLGVKLKEFFYQKRQNFLKDIDQIPISHKAFRLRELEKMYRRAINHKNDILAKEIIEQAAKEECGFYTNKLKVGTDVNDPLAEMLKTFNGGSMPIVHDVDFSDIVSESEEARQVESKPKKTWSKK